MKLLSTLFRPALAVACLVGLGLSACHQAPVVQGVIVVNLSGVPADRPGLLESLSTGAAVFERALSPSTDPLAARVSLASGVYPREHGVFGISRAPAASLPLLAEKFAEAGFRTAAFTTGGTSSADFGLDRGFDFFQAWPPGAEAAPAWSLEKGREFVNGVGEARFFLWLETAAFKTARWELSEYRALAAGRNQPSEDDRDALEAAHDRAAAAVEEGLSALLESLEAAELLDRTILVVTADHGFERAEGGRIGSHLSWPSLRVPLVLRGPGVAPARSEVLVQTVDIAPSLYRLAGLESPPVSGLVLPGLAEARSPRGWAAAETRGRLAQRTFLVDADDGPRQLVESRLRGEFDGTWVTKAVTFDTEADSLQFSIVSYGQPRRVAVAVDGEPWSTLDVGAEWGKVRIDLPGGGVRRRVSLTADDCASPSDSGSNPDRRCLSFKIRGLEFQRLEVFDLARDPAALKDLSFDRPLVAEELVAQEAATSWLRLASPESTTPRAETLARIRELGEYPETPHP